MHTKKKWENQFFGWNLGENENRAFTAKKRKTKPNHNLRQYLEQNDVERAERRLFFHTQFPFYWQHSKKHRTARAFIDPFAPTQNGSQLPYSLCKKEAKKSYYGTKPKVLQVFSKKTRTDSETIGSGKKNEEKFCATRLNGIASRLPHSPCPSTRWCKARKR